MRVVDLIAQKKSGEAHSDDEIAWLIRSYTQGAIPDYQLSAWLMAVCWRGLSEAETFALTGAMATSGDTLDMSQFSGPSVDKHSTGGVGDKTTLAVVPILASAGVNVAKMSGRGLGHTGGTLDKLESIPGTRVQLSLDEIIAQTRQIGACLCAQTDTFVPADAKLYALRDATATVESLPLIAASILSKKLACGSPSILLDVKFGSGAFVKTESDARALAALMVKIGAAHGRKVAAVLSDMNQPLGQTVGNRLEIREILALLQGQPGVDIRLLSLVRHLSAVGFLLANKVFSVAEGEHLADAQIKSGAAYAKFAEIITAQGGDLSSVLETTAESSAGAIYADHSGYVTRLDAHAVGLAAMKLGAGREAKADTIDPTAGLIIHKTVGDWVEDGDVLVSLFSQYYFKAIEAVPELLAAYDYAPNAPTPTPLILDTLGLDTP